MSKKQKSGSHTADSAPDGSESDDSIADHPAYKRGNPPENNEASVRAREKSVVWSEVSGSLDMPGLLVPGGIAASELVKAGIARELKKKRERELYASLDQSEKPSTPLMEHLSFGRDFAIEETIVLGSSARQKDVQFSIALLDAKESDNRALQSVLEKDYQRWEGRRSDALRTLGIAVPLNPASADPAETPAVRTGLFDPSLVRTHSLAVNALIALKGLPDILSPRPREASVRAQPDTARFTELTEAMAGMSLEEKKQYTDSYVEEVGRKWDHASTADKTLAIRLLSWRFGDANLEESRLFQVSEQLTGYQKTERLGGIEEADMSRARPDTYAKGVERLEDMAKLAEQSRKALHTVHIDEYSMATAEGPLPTPGQSPAPGKSTQR
jgi:hypothetical protein